MRILFILEYYYPHIGGVETFFKSLGEHLDDQGHEVTVLTNQYNPLLPKTEDFGQSGRIIRNRYYNRYGFTFLAWRAAMKYAREADIIHTTSYNAAIPAWVAAKFTNTKSVITFHERWGQLWFQLPWMSYPSKWVHYLFEKGITSLRFDRFVGVSDYTKNALIEAEVPPKSVVRIYNGIDYDSFLTKRKEVPNNPPFTFLYFGRIGVAKGLDLLIEGYHQLCQQRTDHRLILVIPSEQTVLYKHLLRRINDLGITAQIQVSHDLSFEELKKYISSCDAVVIPSYSEGFCFAAVETMALNTPIISSGKGALREVVSGSFINLEEHTALHLAQAMTNAIDGNWMEKPIKRFPIKETIDQYLNLYKEILSED